MPRLLRKIAILVVALGVLAWLFVTTLRQANTEPYVVDAAALTGWTLAIEDPQRGAPGVLGLQPPVPMVGDVFRQIFTRTGQSLAGPLRASMPVVLASEYTAALSGILTPDELLSAAREAGLEREALVPVCLGAKRETSGGPQRLRFFLVFESAAFRRFRDELAALHASRGGAGTFDPAALAPVLPVASTEPDFDRWWPAFRLDADADCEAPVSATGP